MKFFFSFFLYFPFSLFLHSFIFSTDRNYNNFCQNNNWLGQNDDWIGQIDYRNWQNDGWKRPKMIIEMDKLMIKICRNDSLKSQNDVFFVQTDYRQNQNDNIFCQNDDWIGQWINKFVIQ